MMLIYPLGSDLSSLRSRRLEVVGERENARPFFLQAPATQAIIYQIDGTIQRLNNWGQNV